jgi:hypothetical protein
MADEGRNPDRSCSMASGKRGASLMCSRRGGLETERHQDARPAQSRTHGIASNRGLAGFCWGRPVCGQQDVDVGDLQAGQCAHAAVPRSRARAAAMSMGSSVLAARPTNQTHPTYCLPFSCGCPAKPGIEGNADDDPDADKEEVDGRRNEDAAAIKSRFGVDRGRSRDLDQ